MSSVHREEAPPGSVPVPARAGRAPGDGWRAVVRTLGELLITLGAVVLLFVAYELYFTNFYTNAKQHQLSQQLQRQFAVPAGPLTTNLGDIPIGAPMAVLYIPRFGADYREIVVQGVGEEQLKEGPGHYPGTAWPGQVGNFVMSGHRTTYAKPFNQEAELRPGDPIVVETKYAYFTYRVVQLETVLPTDMNVIAPVPDHPGLRPRQAWLTMTTCTPMYSASHRLIVHALLADVTPRSAGYPPALAYLRPHKSPTRARG